MIADIHKLIIHGALPSQGAIPDQQTPSIQDDLEGVCLGSVIHATI